jgi:primosomal protein N' (replication factor Y)
MNPRFARILVDGTTDREFDYVVPDALAGMVTVGSRVRLPFRHRQLLGTVVALPEVSGVDAAKLRPVTSVVGSSSEPAIPPVLLELARWIADYYCAPLDQAMRCVLPDVIRKAEMDFKERQFARLVRAPDEEEAARLSKRSPRRAELLAALETAPGQRVQVVQLLEDLGTTRQTLQGLVNLGYVTIEAGTIPRDPFGVNAFIADSPLALDEEQTAALAAVQAMMQAPRAEHKPMLLHGVTGSGKTEVYLQAIAMARAAGRGALVLVPEISLTPQTVERFKSRFTKTGDEVAVLHSRLSEGERHDEWHRIHSGQARIVIGARSAIFAPVREPGLIVVDEEHEASYKQEEAPRYHARDIAVVRAKLEGCPVLLGSATPSLESYHNATTGKYALLRLTTRVDERKMPVIRVVDMRREAARQNSAGPSVLSEKLRAAVTSRLAKGEQTILFLNRRGFASAMLCPKCGFVCECPNCSLALTFHRTEDQLMCHLCGHRQKAPKRCPNPECRDPAIRHRGFGTERVEEVVARVFPKARIARMDADTMSGKHAHRDALGAFKAGKTDILVGTQMIAKGLHFPNVTLVGIINADLSLHMNDFRAAERTFQLLTQVAGRAGRGDMEGEVFVQTCTPTSPAIQFARHHDFEGFWEQESEFRRTCDHPPFTHLILITVRSPHKERAEFSATTMARRLKENLPRGAVVFDPLPAPWEKLKSFFRFQIQLRSRAILKLSRHVRLVLEALPLPEDVQAQVDVDPQQLL